MARQLAQINQTERAIQVLSDVIEKGFVCAAQLENDPCFVSLRSSAHYGQLLSRAQLRRREFHQVFLDAGGPELLNLPTRKQMGYRLGGRMAFPGDLRVNSVSLRPRVLRRLPTSG
jgi:hypothetical protein